MKNLKTLSIVILSFNTKDLTLNCINSVEKARKRLEEAGFTSDVIVVDNASSDSSQSAIKTKFPNVKLIENKRNLGFSAGNNKAIPFIRSEYVLFLNSDTLVYENTFLEMVKFMSENKDVGVATCKVLLRDKKTIDPACHRGFPTPWASFTYFSRLEKLFPRSKIFGQYHQTFKSLDQPHEVDAISGTFFFIRRDVGEKLGWWDEDYFFYGEDLDFCFRVKRLGYKVYYYPRVKILHLKRQSGIQRQLSKRPTKEEIVAKVTSAENFYETMKIFYDKHYSCNYPRVLKVIVFMVIDIKKFLTLTRLRFELKLARFGGL